MRIAQISSYFPPYPGGQERHVYELAGGLADMGHTVTVITSRNPEGDGPGEVNYEVIRLPCRQVGTDALTFSLGKALKRIDAELLHVHSPLSIISTLASVYGRRTPVLVTYHGDYHKSSLGGNILKSLRNHIQLPFVLRNARMVVTLTEHDSELLVGFGIPRERIEVIRPGLDIKKFGSNPRSRQPQGMRILYVGRLVHEKGVMELITAFKELTEQVKGVELIVAGKGPALQDMVGLASGLGIGGRVRFLGWVPHVNLINLYNEATMLVLPSFSEGLPYAVLEAMAAGRPVISSDVSGMRELITHGVNGLLYDISERGALVKAMLRLVGDPEYCMQLGTNASELCRTELTRERWLKNMVRAYEKVV